MSLYVILLPPNSHKCIHPICEKNTAYCKLIDQNNGHLIISLVHKSLDTQSKLSPLTFSNGPIIIRQAREPQDHGDLSDRDWPGAEIRHDQTKQANKINTRL